MLRLPYGGQLHVCMYVCMYMYVCPVTPQQVVVDVIQYGHPGSESHSAEGAQSIA
jgi:hypothetical protein